jgi:hypothetical protein|tara:strand:- start:2170 stop:2379 length:210 start_codon:yes stop_codon:yes gene_type:complete
MPSGRMKRQAVSEVVAKLKPGQKITFDAFRDMMVGVYKNIVDRSLGTILGGDPRMKKIENCLWRRKYDS